MRQIRSEMRLSLVAAACGLMLAACGGGGDGSTSGGKLQLITFNYPGGNTLVNGPTILTATSTSGLPVTFESTTPSICTVSGNEATLVSAGECRIVAHQGGGTTEDGVLWAPADDTSHLFNVLKHPQTITFAGPQYVKLATTPQMEVVSVASSGLPVDLVVDTPTVCTLTGSTLKFLAKGSCALTGTQAGDGNYSAQTAQRFIAVDPLVVADGFTGSSGRGDTSALGTKQGGAVQVRSWSSSINGISNGWESCNPSEDNPDWCYHTVSSEGDSLTSALHMAGFDGWGYGYNRVDIFGPGLSGFSGSGDTSSGLRVTTETALVPNLVANSEWLAMGKPVLVHIDLGKSNGGCNVELSAALFPIPLLKVLAPAVPLTDFAVTNNCGLSDVAAASVSDVRNLPSPWGTNSGGYQAGLEAMSAARASATTLLQTSDIARVRFRIEDQNKDTFADGVLKTDLTISGPITVQ